MNYKNFSNKWRPKDFKEIIGQKYIIQAISNSLILNRIHQVWLFHGTRGIGKTTIARILAKCLNCKKKITYQPCHVCSSCKEISKNSSPDLIEIDAASKNKVEDIREILENVKYFPMKERFKIYLIDEIHMLSKHSFNALLKTLEEPPKYVKFILATTEIQKIPETIISRCMVFKLLELSEKNIKNRLSYILKKEKIKFENNSLDLISEFSSGSVRDAISITEQSIDLCKENITLKNIQKMLGVLENKKIFLLFKNLLKKNSKKCINLINKFYFLGIDPEKILIEIMKLFYHLYLLKSISCKLKNNFYNKNQNIILKKISKNIDYKDIKKYYINFLKGRKNIIYSPSKKIGLEITILYTFQIKTHYNLKIINNIFKKI
ncbi:DNA polymerase III subunit gamma/tau [Buchnera aphidicola]|uniref:DNA polymerase III subunit gamma/tau n=1 Tax=Buchnera aphidicola TaxID=9 RepID=UPI0030EF55AF